MVSYTFTYSDAQGGLIRTTVMQCESDGEAIRRAKETLPDGYATLVVSAGERVVASHVLERS